MFRMKEIYFGKGIRLVKGENKGRYPYCNCLLINNCLIDSGAGRILDSIDFDVVINSHWHEDHISRNCKAKRVFVHESDAEAVENFDEFKRRYALGDLIKIFVNFEFCRVSEVFEDGQSFEFGVGIEVIHTPGHSAGHCCFLIDGRILYLGDIDLSSFGPWYGCIDSSVTDFLKSIGRIKKIDGVEFAIPGHGSVVRGEELSERLEAYREIMLERERRIEEFLKRNENPVGRGIIYRRLPEPEEVFEHFERIMVGKHAERLLRNNLKNGDF
jgi:glyoxylase-like metal-dependent hydrolase (beta-lactamase superfamily II)